MLPKTRLTCFACCVLLASLVYGAEQDDSTLTKVGDAAPKFAIETLDGAKLTPDSVKGKVVLINFFATWCGPCMAEMPELQKQVHEKFKGKSSFKMVSVGREHSVDEVKAFVAKDKYSFAFAADPKREVYGLFAKQYIPRNYVIGPDGKIVYQSMGYSPDEFQKMIKAIETALEQADGKTAAAGSAQK